MGIKAALGMIKDAAVGWDADHATRLAAALAFYALTALAPILIIAIAVAGAVFGEAAAQNQLFFQLRTVVGDQAADLIQSAVRSAHSARGSTLAAAFGLLALVIGATGLFAQLQDAMNQVWEVQPRPGRAIWLFVRRRLESFLVVLAVGVVLLLSLVMSTALSAAGAYFGGSVPLSLYFWRVLDFLVNLGMLWLLVAAIYKLLPDARIAWRDVWIGAAVTAVLFAIGRWAIGLYLAHATVASAYGAAGSLVVILMWAYFSAMIFFFGAEFTQAYAHRRGRPIVPLDYAEPCRKKDREAA